VGVTDHFLFKGHFFGSGVDRGDPARNLSLGNRTGGRKREKPRKPGRRGTVHAGLPLQSHHGEKTEKGTKRILIMDGLIHNMHDLTNPDNLLYEYERIFLALTETFLRDPNRSTKTLTLGGGAMTFPSYLACNFRQARHTVVEIDPKVVEVAYRYFEVPRTEILHIHTVDARLFVQGRQRIEAPWEVIYLDAFNSFSIPYHLTTREFTQGMEKLLHPEGILLANAIDIPRYGRFLGA
jgi:spermidine synthase